MKFAHLADCHLGGWRQPELSALNFQSFQKAISICLKEKVEFILIAGDLFDSAYPSIDTLKETFKEFRKLQEAQVPVFLIAGSHDYSASGKTFLDVLEKAGFCKNVAKFEEKNSAIILEPTIYRNVALYGYPGKKSALEIEEIERLKIQDSPGLFKILMLHTTIRSAVPNPKIKSVDDTKLPNVNYLALGHLHISYNNGGKVYPGPIFPNNFLELEELKHGSFFIFDEGRIKKQEIKLKDIIVVNYHTTNALNAIDELLSLLEKEYLKDKIIIIKIFGVLENGKTSDLDFKKLDAYAHENGAYAILKNTSKLYIAESDIKVDSIDTEDMESKIIEGFKDSNPHKFNYLIYPLIKALQMEKIEDEKSSIFEERLLSEAKKIIEI